MQSWFLELTDISVEQLVTHMSWDEYLRTESPTPDGLRLEFDEGTLVVSPSGNVPHDSLMMLLLKV